MTSPGHPNRREPCDPRVSVIVPALDEAGQIAACIRSAREAGAGELIVVDGGSADGTADEARVAGADAVIAGKPGRAAQMNAGASLAGGDILCFLHADTRIPPGACETILAAMRDESLVGGAFEVRLALSASAGTWIRGLLGVTEKMIGVRSRRFRRFTGDQAIFVRRTFFERMGGYEEIALMEDVRLSAAMRKAGRTVLLAEQAVTSARRWEARGPLRTILLMWFVRAAHASGLSPARCAALYRVKS